jgi:hypothetical protein
VGCSGDRNIDEDERYNRTFDDGDIFSERIETISSCYFDEYESLNEVRKPNLKFLFVTPNQFYKEKFIQINVKDTCRPSVDQSDKCKYSCHNHFKLIPLNKTDEIVFEEGFYKLKLKVSCSHAQDSECLDYSFEGSIYENLRDVEISVSESLRKKGDFTYKFYITDPETADIHEGDIWEFTKLKSMSFYSRTKGRSSYSFYNSDRANHKRRFYLNLPNSLGDKTILIDPSFDNYSNFLFYSIKLEDIFNVSARVYNFYEQEHVDLNVEFRFNLYE